MISDYLMNPYHGNCADLVRDVLWTEYGKRLSIPQFGEVTDANRKDAESIVDKYRERSRKVDIPYNGDVALMWANGRQTHIGVYNNGHVLHLTDAGRVTNTKVGLLKMIGRPLVGYYRI